MQPELLEIPLIVNLLAVFVGALGGTIRAGEDEHTDVVGVFTLAVAMGFGGWIIRDVLLGNLPPGAFLQPLYFVAAAAATVLGMVALYYLKKLGAVLWWLDGVIVGLFACVGANAAILKGLNILPVVIIATIGGVGGLVLCDIFQGRKQSIMYSGPPNAIAGASGALAYTLLYTGTRPALSISIAVAVTVLVRLTGPVFHLEVPQPRKHAYDLRKKRLEAEARRKEKAAARAAAKAAKHQLPSTLGTPARTASVASDVSDNVEPPATTTGMPVASSEEDPPQP